ncbi:DinB family protein [Trinickia sp. NRRL B-1857]|uniref:DinB family protein n=1 Tax=Trinickia sp. NRRL B-1857 TaxID=3162879 RepID=UPI003D27D15C
MSTNDLLSRMLRYQAWANSEVLEAMKGLDAVRHADERHLMLRIMNHCLVVGKIFAAHLVGEQHGFAADNTPDTPELEALRSEFARIDDWYLDYVKEVTPSALSESVPFQFTDGDNGYMTREEMLTHVVIHGGYHRGEACAALKRVALAEGPQFKLPRDTYAVHLHGAEPSRRAQGINAALSSV